MKTKFLKLVLPAFAIMMAIGMAFATEDKPVFRTAHYYIPGDGWNTTTVEDACNDQGVIPCLYEGYQLYSAPNFGSDALQKN